MLNFNIMLILFYIYLLFYQLSFSILFIVSNKLAGFGLLDVPATINPFSVKAASVLGPIATN